MVATSILWHFSSCMHLSWAYLSRVLQQSLVVNITSWRWTIAEASNFQGTPCCLSCDLWCWPPSTWSILAAHYHWHLRLSGGLVFFLYSHLWQGDRPLSFLRVFHLVLKNLVNIILFQVHFQQIVFLDLGFLVQLPWNQNKRNFDYLTTFAPSKS